jgi:LysR family glycine cleavage system transcriptional activator
MAQLPPLPALRALEAAVRHRSYSGAARELNLTHGAISHQLRRLEADLGGPLFRRSGNAMLPTPMAERLARAVAQAFADLDEALSAVTHAAAKAPLVLSLEAQFASRWMASRLTRLTRTGFNLQITVDNTLADFVTDGVDAGVRHGSGVWPGLETQLLLPERVFPVCSPEFAKRYPMRAPEDLASAPLLRHLARPWSLWFGAHNLPTPPTTGLTFDDSALLIDAAVQGLGVALARSGLAERDLREGRLVRALPGELEAELGYYFVWRADSRKLGRINALREWLVAEAAASGGDF